MKQKGFTLIELMIAVAIVGIIAAIAFSTSNSGVLKSRRANAKAVLLKVQSRQEQHFLTNKAYTDDLTQLNYATSPFFINERGDEEPDPSNGVYEIRLEPGLSPGGYTVRATATLRQTEDTQCLILMVRHDGTRVPSPDPNRCW